MSGLSVLTSQWGPAVITYHRGLRHCEQLLRAVVEDRLFWANNTLGAPT